MIDRTHTDQTQVENTDYSAQLETRRRNFLERAAATVTAAVTGVFTGQKLLDKSLHQYINERLYTRDWTNGNLERVFGMIADGSAQTISGSPTTESSLRKWAQEYLSGNTKSMPGTLVGDIHTNAAYRDLIRRNPELIEKVTKNFANRLQKLSTYHGNLIKDLEERYFKANPSLCRVEIDKINHAFAKDADNAARTQAIKELEEKSKANNLFSGSVSKYYEEYDKIDANFYRHTNDAKKALVDKPMFSEMIQRGTEPGRMGLGLRHAHDKRQIIVFAAGAAVFMGFAAHKAATAFLGRNDRLKEQDDSFQAGVVQQRKAAQQSTPSAGHA